MTYLVTPLNEDAKTGADAVYLIVGCGVCRMEATGGPSEPAGDGGPHLMDCPALRPGLADLMMSDGWLRPRRLE